MYPRWINLALPSDCPNVLEISLDGVEDKHAKIYRLLREAKRLQSLCWVVNSANLGGLRPSATDIIMPNVTDKSPFVHQGWLSLIEIAPWNPAND